MIVTKAYKGRNLVYRAYKGERRIWDYGCYTFGAQIADLRVNAKPQAEAPASVLMDADGIVGTLGLARVMGFEQSMARADARLGSNTVPRAVGTVHSRGTAEGLCKALGAAYTHGMVFGSGQAEADATGYAMPRAADTVHSRGQAEAKATGYAKHRAADIVYSRVIAEAKATGYAKPHEEAPLRLMAAADGQQIGSAKPTLHEQEPVEMRASCKLVASCGATVRDVWLRPIQNGTTVYVQQVHTAERTGNTLTLK